MAAEQGLRASATSPDTKYFQACAVLWWIVVPGMLIINIYCSFLRPGSDDNIPAAEHYLGSFATLLTRTSARQGIQFAIVAHTVETLITVILARSVGIQNLKPWILQTAIVGAPSMWLMMKYTYRRTFSRSEHSALRRQDASSHCQKPSKQD
eukprot:ANDGO_05978.mRNA.1 hypothetical protein